MKALPCFTAVLVGLSLPSLAVAQDIGDPSAIDPAGREYSPFLENTYPDQVYFGDTHCHTSASGLAAVWARENTREALWDAMKRKEVYATTGSRLLVRVFGGWDFRPEEVDRWDFAKQGYARGVPMGGDLKAADEGQSPILMIRALRDPDGANLDRIQVVKGWLAADGKLHERIYDVAVSDDRPIGANGRCMEPVGNTVDVEQASFENSIGEPMLFAHWQDPDFDPALHAFYYVRVLEIPTPRWTVYDARVFGAEVPDGVPESIQERAYTSPIWYAPGETN